MARKRVLITLPSEEYRRLADLAEAEERAIDQQASLLLKRLLTGGDRHYAAEHRGGGCEAVPTAPAAEADHARSVRVPSPREWGEGSLS
jgi:hypothetical protein